jgi:hypothetical protein
MMVNVPKTPPTIGPTGALLFSEDGLGVDVVDAVPGDTSVDAVVEVTVDDALEEDDTAPSLM